MPGFELKMLLRYEAQPAERGELGTLLTGLQLKAAFGSTAWSTAWSPQ